MEFTRSTDNAGCCVRTTVFKRCVYRCTLVLQRCYTGAAIRMGHQIQLSDRLIRKKKNADMRRLSSALLSDHRFSPDSLSKSLGITLYYRDASRTLQAVGSRKTIASKTVFFFFFEQAGNQCQWRRTPSRNWSCEPTPSFGKQENAQIC